MPDRFDRDPNGDWCLWHGRAMREAHGLPEPARRAIPRDAVKLNGPQRAILARLTEGGHVTVRDCAAACDRVVSTTWVHLLRLRKLGLVTWEDNRSGTLRLAVHRVAVRS